MKPARLLIGLVAVSVLAGVGCEGILDTLVVRNSAKGGAVHNLFFSASRKGTVLARIYGDPFGGNRQALVAASLRGLSDGVTNRQVQFVDDATKVEQPQNHLVVVFGANPTVSGAELCSGSTPQTHPSATKGALSVRAVFCSSGESLSDVDGVGRNLTGPDDPKFSRLMFDVAYQLIVGVPDDSSCNSDLVGC